MKPKNWWLPILNLSLLMSDKLLRFCLLYWYCFPKVQNSRLNLEIAKNQMSILLIWFLVPTICNCLFCLLLRRYPQYLFISDNAISKSAGLSSRYTKNALLGVITDIHFLSLSDFLVCTFSSQVGLTNNCKPVNTYITTTICLCLPVGCRRQKCTVYSKLSQVTR